jgi:hypothetical protein
MTGYCSMVRLCVFYSFQYLSFQACYDSANIGERENKALRHHRRQLTNITTYSINLKKLMTCSLMEQQVQSYLLVFSYFYMIITFAHTRIKKFPCAMILQTSTNKRYNTLFSSSRLSFVNVFFSSSFQS